MEGPYRQQHETRRRRGCSSAPPGTFRRPRHAGRVGTGLRHGARSLIHPAVRPFAFLPIGSLVHPGGGSQPQPSVPGGRANRRVGRGSGQEDKQPYLAQVIVLLFALLNEVGELGSQELSGHFEVLCIADSIEGLRSGGWEWEYRMGGTRRLARSVGCVCYRLYERELVARFVGCAGRC